MESQNKPLPPFGNIFLQILKANINLKINPWVFCGKYAWQEARAANELGQLALCLPFEKNPEEFSWPVNDLSLIIYHTGGLPPLALSKLAYELLHSNARRVTLHCEHGNGLQIFNR